MPPRKISFQSRSNCCPPKHANQIQQRTRFKSKATRSQILKREPDHLSQKQLAMKSANTPRLAHRGGLSGLPVRTHAPFPPPLRRLREGCPDSKVHLPSTAEAEKGTWSAAACGARADGSRLLLIRAQNHAVRRDPPGTLASAYLPPPLPGVASLPIHCPTSPSSDLAAKGTRRLYALKTGAEPRASPHLTPANSGPPRALGRCAGGGIADSDL
ncbi:Mansc Domain-Containing Protein 4 [Manis pentadactyla]|nr:Mansc Domain-Containing Protein 4 [Manis pentadactyla]